MTLNQYEQMPYEPDAETLAREGRIRMKIIAVGGGACKVLNHIATDWPDAPALAAANTDAKALQSVDLPGKQLIGQSVTRRLGCGGDPRLGRMVADEDAETLQHLATDADLIIILACLGGGTATGVAPALAKAARESGALTLAFVTTPFTLEGPQRMATAREGIKTLRENTDAVVVLPNEHLRTALPADATLEDSFDATDRMIAAALRGLWLLLSQDNTINFDFADLQTLVENAGNECAFGYGEGRGEDRVEQALTGILEGPGLGFGSILANAGAMLVNVIGGRDLSLDELNRVRSRISDSSRNGAQIGMGAVLLDEWAGACAITILAAEHWTPPESRPADTEEEDAAPTTRRKKRTGGKQTSLFGTEEAAAGLFTGSEPTYQGGTDLDTPTYLRRNIRIRA